MTEPPSGDALSDDTLHPQLNDTMSRRLILGGAGLFMVAGSGSAAYAQTQSVSTSHIRFIQPPTLSKQSYSHAVEATLPGRVIYVAGQMGLDINGNLVGAPGDFRAQATQAWQNVRDALAAAGGGIEHIVKVTQFILHMRAHQPILREVRAQFTDRNTPQPASTLMQISAFTREGALYEVEAVAVLPPRTG
jgi:enamine deaminase RidA (YjgF/YER057c/UK114 family)